jgi:asparagine synthase (glutamine-hydrolysing)
MVYRDRFWIIFNGEVYNFIELRTELERLGHVFCSSSDTEVILAAYSEWGTACFQRFRGMWGMVIFDQTRNEVILCRDRLGIKPLYYFDRPGMIAVSSEIKQFQHVPGFIPSTDPVTVTQYLKTGYEDPSRCFFREVHPVEAGTWLRIRLDRLQLSSPEEFWHPERIRTLVTCRKEASELFSEKVRECVRIHLRSDITVGCALSGGLDSTAIAVLTGELRNDKGDPLHTFTSTFPGDASDEREYADAVLAEINATPHFVTPTPLKFIEELDRFVWVHDEPVGGVAMYAGYCVARLTREAGVSVTLNGQGGDEIFSAYWQSYFLHLLDLWRHGRYLTLASHFGGAVCGSGNPTLISQVPVMLRRFRTRRRPPLQVRIHDIQNDGENNILNKILSLDPAARRVYEVRTMFLPRLLKWDDRNLMAFSVEGRYPLLDHELIEMCLSFAPDTLYRQGWTKYPLRIGLKKNLPAKIYSRRSKFGFTTPQDRWLCGLLRPKLERWLESDRPIWDYVEREDVQRLAQQTWSLNGKRDEPGMDLFRIFVFDRWLEIFDVRL